MWNWASYEYNAKKEKNRKRRGNKTLQEQRRVNELYSTHQNKKEKTNK